MTSTARLPGAPGGPMSPISPIPLSPLSPFGPWGPTDTKQIWVHHKKNICDFTYYKDLTEMYHLAFLGFQEGLVSQDVLAVQVYQGARENLVIRLFLELRDDLEMLPSVLAFVRETCSRQSSLWMGDRSRWFQGRNEGTQTIQNHFLQLDLQGKSGFFTKNTSLYFQITGCPHHQKL